jgi:hypothetical protein
MPELIGLLVLFAVGWWLWSNLQAREAANRAMREACHREGLLFLDDTVGLTSLRPIRDEMGRLRLRWVYEFEYSDTGRNRRRGRVAVIGGTVTAIEIDLPKATEGAPLH